jgi:hypothetical protein
LGKEEKAAARYAVVLAAQSASNRSMAFFGPFFSSTFSGDPVASAAK